MNKLVLGQVLGAVFGRAAQRRGGLGRGAPLGGARGGLGGAALGGVLGSVLGRRGLARGVGGGGGLLVAMLLPFALQWVQRNGGLGAVLQRVQERGYRKQAQSWVSTGDNDVIDAEVIREVVGDDELDRVSQQLGVPRDDVKQGYAQILPEMVNQLTPDGQVRPEADDVLQDSIPILQQELDQVRRDTEQPA